MSDLVNILRQHHPLPKSDLLNGALVSELVQAHIRARR